MEVLLRGYGGDVLGATAVLVRCHGGHGGAAATPLRISPTRDDTAEVLNMLKVSAVPPRRSAVLTVFGGATAINEALRNHSDHGGATAVYVVQAPQWHRAFGVMGALAIDINRLDEGDGISNTLTRNHAKWRASCCLKCCASRIAKIVCTTFTWDQ